MVKLFLSNFIDFIYLLGSEGAFLITIGLIVVLTIVCVFLSIFKTNYSLIKRLFILVSFCAFILAEWWIEKTLNQPYSYLWLSVSVCLLCLSAILSIPQKEVKIISEQRKLANYLDSLKKEQEVADREQVNKIGDGLDVLKTKQMKDDEPLDSKEVDFTHVKLILNKLEYYSISSQDKKQAKELENAILLAESNGLTNELKEKINDGLGALLKIMSKYAV